MSSVHVVGPDEIDDPARPSGGNTYDRHLCCELEALGWSVHAHPASGFWDRPDASALAGLDRLLGQLPAGALVLVDGLVASAAPGVVIRRARRLRVVVLVHLPFGLLQSDPVVRRRERSVLSAASAVLTTSEWTREQLIALYGLPAARLYVAVPGAAPAALAPGSTGGGRLLSVAAITPIKGHDVVVGALRSIAEFSWEWTCVGSLEREPQFVAAVRGGLSESGLAERVSLCGTLTGDELERAYASADVVISASRLETYGMVITEALAHGLPVIATDVGGIQEAMGVLPGGERPGLLVPADNPEALRAAIETWLRNAELRARLRRAATARRESLPEWSATASTVADVLRSITHDPRQSPLARAPRAG